MGSNVAQLKTLPGDPPVEIVVRQSARARRITLRVSTLDGRVTLTRPRGVSEGAALAFADTKSDWLRAQVGRVSPPRGVHLGGTVPVAGEWLTVTEGRPGFGDGTVQVRAGRPAGRQVAAILKTRARDLLSEAIGCHARALGLEPGRLTLRDTRSRWGSCTSSGDLMFSWRLVMAPPEILDYVAAHEVAHLRHMDHSAAFWSVVESRVPDWRDHRDWLRREGAGLHAWRFDE